jgi:Protein of unknown function (DUF1549)/Protein of unknown function (DUF1553)/Bacterial Ig-like domain (group 2)
MHRFMTVACMLMLYLSTIQAQLTYATEPIHITDLQIDPPHLLLTGPNLHFLLLASAKTIEGKSVDMTHRVVYQSLDDSIATVTSNGWVTGKKNGRTEILIKYGELKAVTKIEVSKCQTIRQLHFENDITPLFNKFGCNSSGCHGKAEGKNGFKLSIFGFNPDQDRLALITGGRGRRVFQAAPEESLLLLKASGQTPHGGGVHIREGTQEYQLIRDWIQTGMPEGNPDAPHVVSIDINPKERSMSMKTVQQLRVIVKYSNNHEVDVTRHARFHSNNEPLAKVDESGLVTISDVPGEVAIMANYMGAVNVFRALIPQPDHKDIRHQLPKYNFIDGLVDAKLEKLNINSSTLCSDEDFLRRVYLDVIGTLPTIEECIIFLSDTDPKRREKLVEELLSRPEYARYWALKWSDLLRVDRLKLGHKGAYNYYRWIRECFSENKPFNKFAKELVIAEGPVSESPAGYFYKAIDNPGQAASTLAQVFLGIRIECAQCHHHPTDRWGQSDYYAMRALFSQVQFKSSQYGDMLQASKIEPTMHPRTGKEVMARPLGTPLITTKHIGDRRHVMASWMTSNENQWFAQNVVNRIWAHFLGRGIIEPVDDVRSTNPPTNPELLNSLTKNFIEHKFNLHHLIKTIVMSRTYQLSSTPNSSNQRDEQNYSRALLKSLDAEVLLDAIIQSTGVQEKFPGIPAGSRSIDLWDSQVSHYFLKLFGRPTRSTACQCERTVEPNVSQILHVLNSPEIHSKLEHEAGHVSHLVHKYPDNVILVKHLYLNFLCRYPTEEEIKTVTTFFAEQPNRRRAAEDVAWSMINSIEFLFNH